MEKKIDITKILRVIAMFSLVFFLFACGDTNSTPDLGCEETSEEEFEQQHHECWQAAMLGAIYKTTGKLAMAMYDKLTQGAMALMMVAFAVWLSFRMLKHLSSFTEESPAEVWTEIIKKFFVCLVCGILASSTTGVMFVLNSIIFPVYNAFLELGSAMIGHVSANKEIAIIGTDWSVPIPFTKKLQMQYDILCKVGKLGAASLDQGFPAEPQKMMECLTCAISERMNFGIKLGWIVVGQVGVMALVCGVVLIVTFWIVKIGFAFYLVDSIFRFAMMTIMLPLLIMAYAFKPTSKWTKVGFLTIINSAAFMMCIALIMIMIFAATQQVLNEQQVALAFSNRLALADFSVPMIMLLLIAFLAVGSLGVAKNIVDQLVGGGGEANFQKRAGKALMGVAKWAGGLVGKAAMNAALANSAKLRNIKAGADAIQAKLNSWAGRE